MIRVLALGGGIQSAAIILMACRGELPKPHHAIFSDLQWEPSGVYRQMDLILSEAKNAGIPIHTLLPGDIRQDAIDSRQLRVSSEGKRYASIPLFVRNGDGSTGRIRRQCTSEYKIKPIDTFIRREILGIAFRKRAPKTPVVEQWFGITADEIDRATLPQGSSRRQKDGTTKKTPIRWKKHAYPFLGLTLWWDGDKRKHSVFDGPNLWWNRSDCMKWLQGNYPQQRWVRSACIGCPYRSDAEWQNMKENDPESWRDAIEFDKAIRVADAHCHESGRVRLKSIPFIHRSCVPLDQVNFKSRDEEGGIFSPGAGEACEGMCGV